MYLKVPSKKTSERCFNVTVEQVVEALGPLAQEYLLTVDNDLNYPCVEFPSSTPYSVYKKVQEHLQALGYEAY